MFKNYFTTIFRNLLKSKAHSTINLAGLSVGMAVAILIGIWISDELSFDKYHKNYDRIAMVMQKATVNGSIHTGGTIPWPMEAEMRQHYGSDFKQIVMSSFIDPHVLIAGEKKVSFSGSFIGAGAPDMLSLNMIHGSRKGLEGSSAMLISASVAKALFGDDDPMGKLVMLDNKAGFKVSGVYEDLPSNTSFHDMAFMAPWEFFANSPEWIQRSPTNWSDNSLFMYVQLADHSDIQKVSEKIKNITIKNLPPEEAKFNLRVFLQPMSRWHLHGEFKNGENVGGAIQNVWMFGIIAVFVLLLACINFMNLSTARSEKRAKEVGIRKAIGSLRNQLIALFYAESLTIVLLAFCLSLLLVSFALPIFGELAGKEMILPWSNPWFWALSIGFILFTALVAGSYPALYLSSFNPIKVLKGAFKTGRLASIPRKVLVVVQFSVSLILIIGTMVVFRQIQVAKTRPVGYNRDGLVYIETTNDDLADHFDALKSDLLRSGKIIAVAKSTSPATGINNYRNDISWKGKDPSMTADFGNINLTTDFGKALGWHLSAGRDFSAELVSDSSSLILNEAAAKYMALKNPIGEIIRVGKKDLTVIGVVKDILMGSPYEPVKPTIFRLGKGSLGYVNIKINPSTSAHDAMQTIEAICKTYSPSVPFSYRFADDEYQKKFMQEERVGRLAVFFAALAIFISCLGLFGMASFMAEQRFREIGLRKVLGASGFSIWKMLSREFVILVMLSFFISIPLSYYFMLAWLQNYEYRANMPWWIFVSAGAGSMLITVLTVSYQSIKAASMNPVNSLKAE